MGTLKTPTKMIIILLGIALGLCFWSYLSSAIFFSLADLPDSGLKPFSIFEYYQAYGHNPAVLKKIMLAAGSPLVLVAVLSLLMLIKNQSLYGDARFARRGEIQKRGLFGGKGILLGKIGGKFIVACGTEHVLVAAPSRSGKGVGIVIPNLLNWDESAVVLDIKLENFKATSGFREASGQQTFLFNPADPAGETHHYNPLGAVSTHKAKRIDDLQKIANFLAPNPLQGDPMWSSEARKIFLAVALYLIDTNQNLTLGEVYRFINGASADEIEEQLDEHEEKLDQVCINNFLNFLNMGEKQRSGVKSTLTSALDLFDNPMIDAATSKSDFSFEDLRKKKMTIYVGVTPNNLTRLKPLLNLFFQQCIDLNTSTLPDPVTHPYKVLLLMDEFTALGRMDIIKDGIAFFAGYHLRLMPIIQSPSQLADKYGEEAKRAMISNFMYRVIFAPNDPKDAEELSRELGNKTVNQKSRSKSMGNSSPSTTTSKTSRALMLPQEVKQLNQSKEIIIVEAMLPIMADKIRYYDDSAFKDRFFNIFDPSKNTGKLPAVVPKISLDKIAEDQVKTNISKKGTKKPVPDNTLFEGLDELTGIGKKKKSLFSSKKLSAGAMDNLLDEFWATGTT